MHEPLITLVGNVGKAPRRRTTNAGVVVVDFRLASTPRRLDKMTGVWSDGETTWFGVTCWRALAEHVADSLTVGDRVVVTGRLTTSSWRSDTGEPRSSLEVEATTVGLDLTWAKATPERRRDVTVDWQSSGQVDPQTGEVVGSREASPSGPVEPVAFAQPAAA